MAVTGPEIAERLSVVRARVDEAARRVGRAPESVRLIAVSKLHPVEAILAAYEAGQRDFGESYAQELAEKHARLSHLQGLRLHFIGAFQKNKAKAIVPTGAVIHTLATLEHARSVETRAQAEGLRVTVLIQVNVAGEAQKHGCRPDRLGEVVAAVRSCGHLDLRGLMVIPPDDEERTRHSFATLRALAEEHGLTELSMGMSGDLELAIAHGATMVRVGTAIFGPRP